MKVLKLILMAICLALPLASCSGRPKQYKVETVNSYPHDEGSYTQGLFFDGGKLYESTGQYGESTFRLVDLSSGKALRRLDFGKKYFVEGSCILDGKLYILTWQENVAFEYDAKSLKFIRSYSYPREGWGLTTDGKQLIASDGSAKLFFMDGNFKVQRTVEVKLNGRPLRLLNELEWIDGKIWANVYTSDMIVIINPSNGEVEATVDCTGLLPRQLRDSRTDVLNGIAYNPIDKKIYLTGKCWKRLYEVRLIEK